MRSTSSLNLHYFRSFNCSSVQFFIFGISTFVYFNVFVSFSGFSKGASTITKGFTCSLQFERAKFLFFKLFLNFLVRRGVDLYAAA